MKITKIKASAIDHVYSGKDGKCCCGCSGTHSTDARQITRITNIINKEITTRRLAVEFDASYAAVAIGNRIYIAYFTEKTVQPAGSLAGGEAVSESIASAYFDHATAEEVAMAKRNPSIGGARW